MMYKVIGTILIGMVVIPPLYTLGPVLEGRFAPVMKVTRMASVEPVEGGVIVTFEFEKYRANCTPLPEEFSWFLGKNRKAEVLFYREDGERVTGNPPGEYISHRWFIGVNEKELLYNSTAYYTHKCHPLWLTRTKVWVPQELVK